MKYKNLGKSGLKISVISYGTGNMKETTYLQDKQMVKKCIQVGINYFDTAQAYGGGQSQVVLGKILKQLKIERQNIIVGTKVWVGKDPFVNSITTLNRKHLKQAINASLNRLQLNYVDILFAHAYDEGTSMEEICRGFHQIIQSGKSFYWGTSNWDAQNVFQAFKICEKLNLHKPICAQNQYNMLVRKQFQFEYQSLFKKYNYGSIAWSPLAGGYLTGKHLKGISEQQGNRMKGPHAQFCKMLWFTPYQDEKITQNLIKLKQFAQNELKTSLANLALAWCIKFEYLSSALIGNRKLHQLQDNLKALQIVQLLTEKVQKSINDILKTQPVARTNFLEFKPQQNIRTKAK